MHPTRPLISLFPSPVWPAWRACTAGTSAPSPERRNQRGRQQPRGRRRHDRQRRRGRHGRRQRRDRHRRLQFRRQRVRRRRPPAACRTSRSNLKPPEILLVLDRSVTMGRNLMDDDRRHGRADQVGPGDPGAERRHPAEPDRHVLGPEAVPAGRGRVRQRLADELDRHSVAPGNARRCRRRPSRPRRPSGNGTPTGAAMPSRPIT